MTFKLAVAISALLLSASCTNTVVDTGSRELAAQLQPVVQTTSNPRAIFGTQLSLNQIMADQDWVARSPESAYWMADGSGVLFAQKRQGSQLRDWHHQPLTDAEAHRVPLERLHYYAYNDGVYSRDRSLLAYTFEGNVFVRDIQSGATRQFTRDAVRQSQLKFLSDDRLSYRQGNDFFVVDTTTGLTSQLIALATADAPEPVAQPEDFIAREQLALIDFVQRERDARAERFSQQQMLQQSNSSVAAEPFYVGANKRIVAASLSPAGDRMLVAITAQQELRDASDIMPNYVAESGRVTAEDVRSRVADAKPVEHQLLLLNLLNGEQTELSYESLPGWDEDVLAAVRIENHEAQGKTYISENKPRAITLIFGSGWTEGAIRWSDDGSSAAVMLEAWDNKDRWIASVDFDANALRSQHRLHDEAWINNTFNEFGFLPRSSTLWYQSEEDGFAHIYTKAINAAAMQLTRGRYVTDNLQVSHDSAHIYFNANVLHPGNYEIFRVAVATGQVEQLTALGGINNYKLSPAEDALLITHSSALLPPELYVQTIAETMANKLTNTVTEHFMAVDWSAPKIVPIPSSHVSDPIYTRVYFPSDFDSARAEKYPAVIFTHGAGYLQNAHGGWSGYPREFMFHTFLTQHGYVVLDLDYRGSKGYGRDWRTAVYRQMGTPEVEDLIDVVNWAGVNANVDVNRMGTYGGSYGGFLTFMSLFKQPGLFKAGAALRPVTDWAHYNTGYTSNILNLPDDDPIAYRRSSPIYFTEGLQDALLINAPMVDDNVFFQDTVRLVQRLIELEKENFETAIYPVESHAFRQPASWLDEYRRIFKLFEDNLK